MHQAITGYSQDDEGHWMAKLDCGHHEQMRHDLPKANNAWVLTKAGRDDKVGVVLICSNCIAGIAPNR